MELEYVDSGPVTVYGFFFVAALLTIWLLARRNAGRAGIDGSHIDMLFPIAIAVGIVAGWFLSLAMPRDLLLAGEVLRVDIRPRLYALVLFGAVVVFVYSRINGLSFRRLLDAFALPMLAGIVVGRFGCFFAGCCWGDVAVHDAWLTSIAGTGVGRQVQTLPWFAGDWVRAAVEYGPGKWAWEQHAALGLIAPDAEASLPVHPVQLYEAALVFVAIIVLRRLQDRGAPGGWLAAATVVTYAAITFSLEYLRADGLLVLGNLNITQLQSFVIAAVATTILWQMRRQPA